MNGNKFTIGSVPYGYTVDGDALAADKDRAAVILEIFQSKAAGRSLQQIADALNKKGVKTIRGGDFTKQGVKYILGNRAYIGEYHHNGTVYTIPAIVDKQLFNEINGVKTTDLSFDAFIFDPAFSLNNR
jgi:hypothetical protein